MGVYNRAPLAFERGRGARLFSTTGEEYLDCVAGIATCGLGHAHPVLVDALKTQGEKLWHVSNIYTIPEQEVLADRCARPPSPTWCSSPIRAPRRSNAP
jgi:acetylornithine/N-succinyldiaminopimelate aminotransferase